LASTCQKNVIRISVASGHGKELLNRSLARRKFAEFLGKQKPAMVSFEVCATAHFRARTAQRHGHVARIIPARAVAPFRQGHKTDRDDALALANKNLPTAWAMLTQGTEYQRRAKLNVAA